MASNTCPKCGAENIAETGEFSHFECGSYYDENVRCKMIFTQSYRCELSLAKKDLAAAKKELAELKERHQRLVDAARKVAGVAVKITGGMGEFVGWEIDVDEMNGLKQALEREPSNETKPSERGCPFDEARESEAKQ